jgi:hypothetical protein
MSSVCHFCPISLQSVRMHRLQQKPQIWNVKKRALWELWRPMRTDMTGTWSLFATASRTRLKIDSSEQQTKSDSWPICTAGTSGEWSWSAKQQTATFSASSSLLLHVWCIPCKRLKNRGSIAARKIFLALLPRPGGISRAPGLLSNGYTSLLRVKQPEHETEYSSLPTATTKNVWNLTSTSYVP